MKSSKKLLSKTMSLNQKGRTYIKPEIAKIIDENYQDVFGIAKILHELLLTHGYRLSRYMISKYLQEKGLIVRGGKNSLKHRIWSEKEIKILERYAGLLPLEEIVKKINQHCLDKKISFRSAEAVRAKIFDLNLSVDVSDTYLSYRQMEKVLNISYDKVIGWTKKKELKEILKPIENGNRFLVHKDNFKKFIIYNKDEIVNKCYPDWQYILSLFE